MTTAKSDGSEQCPCCGDELGVPVERVKSGEFAHISGTEGDCPDCKRAEAELAGRARIAAIRRVLTEGASKVDGVLVDSFTASAITQVYDALNEHNRKHYSTLTIGKMASIAWRFAK